MTNRPKTPRERAQKILKSILNIADSKIDELLNAIVAVVDDSPAQPLDFDKLVESVAASIEARQSERAAEAAKIVKDLQTGTPPQIPGEVERLADIGATKKITKKRKGKK